MTDKSILGEQPGAGPAPAVRGALARWTSSLALLNVPKAAGPIAFSLLSLPLTGDPTSGAAIMLAMTCAQLAGAVPITRLGRNCNAVLFFKVLLTLRTAALGGMVALALAKAPFVLLVSVAALAGLVDGAAFSFLRSILRYLIADRQIVRALAVGSTLNEVTFVAAPVAASALSTISPSLAVLVSVLLGAAPLLLIPSIPAAVIPKMDRTPQPRGMPGSGLWLLCSCASGAAVGAIEVGAVAIAIRFGFEPELAVIFTVALCLASISGGAWISFTNRMIRRERVALLLLSMAAGSAMVALEHSVVATVVGCLLVGAVIAPLSTYYSVAIEGLAPPDKWAEAFALLRTANSFGLVLATATLTWAPLEYGLALGAACSTVAFMAATGAIMAAHRDHR
ncbi:MFS transporter [Brucella intermedia GD04153]|uniref:MFS transporter n=1 Tax=Brucella intermedia GD04153 TaxID=2975438 RepID=A0AA42H5L5_9HYPH|nr:MFS transporter [Brucella intermedia]MDH0127047.1 MFS transporter [Brucella intermedia GD04153]